MTSTSTFTQLLSSVLFDDDDDDDEDEDDDDDEVKLQVLGCRLTY